MNPSKVISRPEIISAMEQNYNAEISETFVHNWARCDTVVVNQGDNVVENDALDFHLLEFYRAGGHRYEGIAELETGDAMTTVLTPGCIGYYQPNSEVSQTTLGSAKLHQIYVDDVIFRETAQSVLQGDPDKSHMLGFHGVFDPKISGLAEKLLEEARLPGVGSDLRADLICQEIALLMLRRRHAGRFISPARIALSNRELAIITSYLEEQLEDIGGMEALAGLLDMDVFRFTRAFRETTGTSPHQYIIQRRINRVKDLLRHTNESLADIAYGTGFASQAHMTATFTKRCGISPGRWRKLVSSD